MNEASVIRPEDLQSGVLGKPAAVRPPTQSRQMPAVPLAYAVTVLIAWLSFLRPFEWVTAIYAFPVGNILGICSLTALAAYFGSGRRVRLSVEMKCFLLLFGQFCLAVPFANWRGGAFEKFRHDIAIIMLMSSVLALGINSVRRLRHIVWIEAISMVVITIGSLISPVYDREGRLEGMGGTYNNSNDLAGFLAITVPFCLFFLFSSRSPGRKIFWGGSAAAML